MCTNGNNILDIGGMFPRDESIVKKEFYTYLPYTNSFGESEEVRIAIPNQDACLLPCESYLYMQFTVITEQHNKTTPEKDRIKFVNNFPSFLFSDARYELNGVEIDRIRNVGITSTLKLSAASCLSNTTGYQQFNEAFAEKIAQEETEKLTYDVLIPLSIWFGFCDDYRKIVLNSRHELILLRARNSINCFSGGSTEANAANVKITIDKLEWKMPYITLADNAKWGVKSLLSTNKRFSVQYRSWDLYEYPVLPQTTHHIWPIKTVSHLNKPRYVLVGFQHDKKEKKTADASRFGSTHINNVHLHLNSNEYPSHMHDFNVGLGKFAEIYQAYAGIQSSYYNGLENKNPFGRGYGRYQVDTIFAFDTSRSDESIKNGAVDIRLEIKASENIPANCAAYCLIIYENEFEYSPFDGMVVRNV